MKTSPPPIVQLLLTVQFQPSVSSLSMLDWTALHGLFAEEFPVFAQIPRAGAMPARLGQMVIDGPFGLPRMSMATSDLSSILMLQDDRVSFGWQRNAPLAADPDYPGFTSTLSRATAIISKVMEFISSRATETVSFSAGELAYTDAFLTHKNEVAFRRMEDIFTCINSNKNFLFNVLNMVFQRNLIVEQGDAFAGMLETTISGFSKTVDGNAAVNLQTIVRFELSGNSIDGVEKSYILAHKVAEEVFATLVKPEAYAISEPS